MCGERTSKNQIAKRKRKFHTVKKGDKNYEIAFTIFADFQTINANFQGGDPNINLFIERKTQQEVSCVTFMTVSLSSQWKKKHQGAQIEAKYS